MKLLIDENVPQSVAAFFRERGHEVLNVREVLFPGASDHVIAAAGDEISAIVVTWNQRDFRRLAARSARGGQQSFRSLGRISFRCNETRGRQRAEALIDSIEFEYEQAQKRPDSRLMIEIGESYFRVLK